MSRVTVGTVAVVLIAGFCTFGASFAGATLALGRDEAPLGINATSALVADYSVDEEHAMLPPLSPDVIDAARDDDANLHPPTLDAGIPAEASTPTPTAAHAADGRTPSPVAPDRTATATPSPTASPSPTETRPTATPTPRATGGTAPAPTSTPLGPVATPTPRPTQTAKPATPTPTATSAKATPTSTPTTAPTVTPSATPSKTPTSNPVKTATPAPTPKPGATETPTATKPAPPSATATQTPTPAPSPTATPTPSPTPSPTPVPPPPPASGAKGQLTSAWQAASALLGTNGGAYDSTINSALAQWSSALAGSNWSDPNHVTTQQVFQLAQQGATQLAGVPGSAAAQNEAAGAMRTVATTLIADAIVAGGSPGVIAQAQVKITNGDVKRLAGDYAGAISEYRLGWNLAENSLH